MNSIQCFCCRSRILPLDRARRIPTDRSIPGLHLRPPTTIVSRRVRICYSSWRTIPAMGIRRMRQGRYFRISKINGWDPWRCSCHPSPREMMGRLMWTLLERMDWMFELWQVRRTLRGRWRSRRGSRRRELNSVPRRPWQQQKKKDWICLL